jgi:hypothetical protein
VDGAVALVGVQLVVGDEVLQLLEVEQRWRGLEELPEVVLTNRIHDALLVEWRSR